MGNFFKNLKPKADLSRHGFDLSQRHVFSAPSGALLPILNLACVPQDYHEIRVSDLLRAMPMQSAAFLRAKQQIDFFFVPYQQLWRYWQSFINQRVDKVSTYDNSVTPVYAPNFSLGNLLSQLWVNNSDSLLAYDVNGFSSFQGGIRLLDLLGYGNFAPYCDLTQPFDPKVSHSSITESIDGNAAWGGLCEGLANTYVNPWPILAYQKIWSDFYRNPYWDTEVNPYFFNVDFITGNSVESSHINQTYAYNFFRLRYRSWKKDYFTSLLPDSQFGGVSIASVSGDFVLNVTPANSSGTRLNMYQTGSAPGTRVGPSGNTDSAVFKQTGLGVDILELRKAQALQAWKEKVVRAGYRGAANAEAHFGAKPRFIEDSHPVFLGSVENNVVVDDVQATAQTDVEVNGKLGDLAGKGISFANDGQTIKFNCDDFGVLMAIMSIYPETEYNSAGLDKDKTLIEPFDYYTPEFQNLGLEAVPSKELFVDGNTPNTTIGFAPRYYGYKSAYDKVHGEFCHQNFNVAPWRGCFRSWVTPLDRFQYGYVTNDGVTVIHPNGLAYATNQYVSPSVLDSVFYEAYNGTQLRDQFICDVHFNIKSVRAMSVLGLPTF